jgi:hypothetical protein
VNPDETIISKILNYTNLSSGEDDKLKVLENVSNIHLEEQIFGF